MTSLWISSVDYLKMKTTPICRATKTKQYISMKKKLLILPLLLLSALFSSCSMDDPTEDDFVINYAKIRTAYYEALGGELTLAAMDVDVDYTTYIENAFDAFEDAEGSIRESFYKGNDVTSDYEREELKELIEEVENVKTDLVITVDNRPESCVVRDMESGLSFQVTYSGNIRTVEEL